MDPVLFKKLNNCNTEKCWEQVRDVIAAQLMGENIFPVPVLRDAPFFDIGHVILKRRRNLMEKMLGSISSAVPVGQLSRFVPEDHEHNVVQRLGNVKKDATSAFNQAYEFHESDMKHGKKKTVTVQLWGCEKWAMDDVPNHGDLTLIMDKKGYLNIDRIFLITEAFYVTEVKVHVAIDNDEDEYHIKGRIPIGFNLIRYKLSPNGMLDSKKNVKRPWQERWIKNYTRDKDDPLPFDPFQAGTLQSSVSGSQV